MNAGSPVNQSRLADTKKLYKHVSNSVVHVSRIIIIECCCSLISTPIYRYSRMSKTHASCLSLFSTMPVGTTAVEMVDMATQSETEDLSDNESNAQQNFRKPSSLQVVPEEEHEEDEVVNLTV